MKQLTGKACDVCGIEAYDSKPTLVVSGGDVLVEVRPVRHRLLRNPTWSPCGEWYLDQAGTGVDAIPWLRDLGPTGFERDAVRVLQRDVAPGDGSLSDAQRGARGGREEVLLETTQRLGQRSLNRRLNAVPGRRQAGLTANGMLCPIVPDDQDVRAARVAAASPAVSHCYQRPPYGPRWLYRAVTRVAGGGERELPPKYVPVEPVFTVTLYWLNLTSG